MSSITTRDGTHIVYKDRGSGQPVLFRHGWRWCMQAGHKRALDRIEAFPDDDLTDDLRSTEVPVLVAHGDDDQIVAVGAAAHQAVELLPDATLKVYRGAPHGLHGATFELEFNDDLLAFLNEAPRVPGQAAAMTGAYDD